MKTALEVFDAHMPGPNQLNRRHPELNVTAEDLLRVPEGPITPEGLRANVAIGLRYLASWLSGNGCVPIFNLMEDAATAEISRAQIWQWVRHPRGRFVDGRRIYAALVEHELRAELAALHESLGPEAYLAGNFDLAAELFLSVSVAPDFVDFLTLPAYEHLA